MPHPSRANQDLLEEISVLQKRIRELEQLETERTLHTKLFIDLSKTEKSLRESEEKFRALFENNLNAVAVHEIVLDDLGNPVDYIYLQANPAFEKHTGMRVADILGKRVTQTHPGIEKTGLIQTYGKVALTGEPTAFELFFEPLQRCYDISAYKVGNGRFAVVFEDISERKRAEGEREATIKLLSILNTEDHLHDLMKAISLFLHGWSGCGAVGIRLRDGDDFPYFETLGFPNDFVELENHLCTLDLDGQVQKDEMGHPLLECMCGNILCGRFDPSLPFFTEHGSFWSNGTTQLLATTTEADRQARTRNRCNGEGYESVALIPLRLGKTTFGLVQLNDKRPGRFAPEMISQMERMADSIAISLSQRQARQELRLKEQELIRVMETSPVGITQVDAEGNIVFANLQAEQVLGLTKNQILQRSYNAPDWKITDFKGNPLPDEALPFEMIKKNHRPVYNVQHAIVWPDGRRRYLSINAAPLSAEAGRFDGMVAAISDITNTKLAEEERASMEERLQRAEKMEALGQLSGGVAHDLNNVLGIVVGYAEMLLEEMDESNPMRNDLKKIMESGHRSAAIVQDLLTLARRGVQTRKVVNLNTAIMDCQKTPEFEKVLSYNPKVRIRTDLEADLLNIMGSPVHLGKTIINLVSNAIEAMPEGGTLTIRTNNRYLDRPIQGYDAIREGDYVVLTVSDTGEGIPERDIKHIFEPFYTKKIMGRSGTGLGLAVVWGTVKDHNGYIDVRSEEGKGTTFTIYFPVTREEVVLDQISIPESEYMGRGETILVLDDVDGQRELAARMLSKLNYKVTTVASGEEAIAYLRTNKADLIVLDMIMDPGMDGLETYGKILEISPTQKAIIVSGFSESERVQEAQKLGAGPYIKKPYVLERLGLAVRKELDGL